MSRLDDIRADEGVKALGLVLRAVQLQKGMPAGKGTVQCPRCEGKLHFQFVRGRGSTRRSLTYDAKCETADCITFMGH